MSAVEWLFWSALALGVYPYAIYPAVLVAFAILRGARVAASDRSLPEVVVVTAAYNEARHIEATVRNKLAQDYPRERLSVIVVSDASDDGTDAVVESIAREDARVRLLRQDVRQGKTMALNRAIREARAEIIVFADANSIYRPDAIRRLMRNFADPAVGYVTGRMLYVSRDGSLVGDGCSAYMRYENWLRKAETRLGSIVGADGGIDAVRRALYRPMRADQLPDFVLPLDIVEQGRRVVYDPDAVLTEETLAESAAEFRMRVRVALRAFWALRDKARLLNPFRYGVFAWQLASHKLLRYLSFLPLAIAAVLNWLLLGEGDIYFLLAVAQVAVALVVILAALAPSATARMGSVRLCSYFVLLNLASAVAAFRFLKGHKQVLWTPRTG